MHQSSLANNRGVTAVRRAVPYAEPVWQNTVMVSTVTQLRNALTAAGTTPTLIELTNSIALTGGQLIIPANAVIKLTSSGGPYEINANQGSRVLYITVGATVYLQDIIITGGREASQGGGIYNAGTLVLQSGAEISENTALYDNSGGNINVGNGGGVYSSGTFIMTGGLIASNSALYNADGGGYGGDGGGVYSSGTFTMTGGLIASNTAAYNAVGGGYGAYGGGVYNSGIFTMEGGEVSDNTATYQSNNGYGGGVYNTGMFTMINGLISLNSAGFQNNSGYGAGVCNYAPGNFILDGGEISQNTSPYGGGVFNNSLFTMNGGEIRANIVRSSGGGVYNITTAGIFTMTNGVISQNSAQSGGGVYNTGDFSITGGTIAGNNASANGGGIYQAAATTLAISGLTQITDNMAGGSGGGIWIAYANLANLTVGPEVVFANNSASQAYNINPADIPLHDTHILTHSFTVPFIYGYNNYDISYTNGTVYGIVRLAGSKIASGVPLVAGQFDFGLYDGDDQLLATTTNDAAGAILFPAISLGAGTYFYTIRELTASGNGWTTDSTIYPVTITVSASGAVQITYPNGQPAFVNIYAAAPAMVNLIASKAALGAVLPAARFEFGVFDGNGNLIVDAANDVSGGVVFPALLFTQPGVYSYTVRELTPSGGGWTTDDTVYPVTVTVTDDGQGQLITDVTYPDGQPAFTNTYSTTPTSMNVVAYKELLGWDQAEIPFSFGLYDQNGVMVETASNQDGVITFPLIPYTAPGIYHYTIQEITPTGDGWTTDSTVYPVVVTVTDDSQSQLIADVTYPDGQPTFVNIYAAPAPAPVEVTLQGRKRVCGVCMRANLFTFGLFDQNENEVSRTANDANGFIDFPSVTFDQPGVYKYTIRELNVSGCGWVMDSSVYPVLVTVAANGSGQLTASLSYPNAFPVFLNCYCPPCCCR
jgi:pilin isopeptide linkage protein